MHTIFNAEDFIVFLFLTKLCKEAIFLAYKMSCFLVFADSIAFFLKGVRFVIKRMDRRCKEYCLLSTVTHFKNLFVFASEFYDFFNANTLFNFLFGFLCVFVHNFGGFDFNELLRFIVFWCED